MSGITALARRLQCLTTDARPDPPRIITEENLNVPPTEIKQKSVPATPEPDDTRNSTPEVKRQTSESNTSIPQPELLNPENSGSARSFKSETRSRSPRGYAKSKRKTSPNANIVNYNIINGTGINIGPKVTYVSKVTHQYGENRKTNSEGFPQKPKFKPMPHDVMEISKSKKEISRDDMLVIKSHIGYGWRDVARKLGYSEGQVEQFEENYKDNGIAEVVYKLLLDWKQAKAEDAQLGQLISIIWSCREYDCAEQLADSYNKPA
ncbi:protein immune deficiency [Neodiprion fabricii]|uniref:protein immune deficiency n=1 Tax=Neodiprion fabricii TaxID=2872261 RepID=UPI001ED8D70E|nr:protein immune deficiency [Neodiprion fabricii]